MTLDWNHSILIGTVILAAAIPYTARIRHPDQKPLAAYLIFLTVFVTSAVVLFSLAAWLATRLGLAARLDQPALALVFLVVVFVPAIALATWQAAKPPWKQRGPPD
jgi:hypothetical protein